MILYTRYQCSACENVKTYLAEKGVEYRLVNIQDDYDAAFTLIDAGIRSVPVLETATGERFVGAAAIQQNL